MHQRPVAVEAGQQLAIISEPDGALVHGSECRQVSVAGSRSSNFAAVGHSKQRHSVENLAANLHFYPLPRQTSTPHVATEDRLVSVDGILHHAALAVACQSGVGDLTTLIKEWVT